MQRTSTNFENAPIGSLRARRGLSITLPSKIPLSSADELPEAGVACASHHTATLELECEQRHELRAERVPFAFSLKPFPGAFPSWRTIFFFNWDDTLCPTRWIRSLIKEEIIDSPERDWCHEIPAWCQQPLPDDPAVHTSIRDLQEAVVRVIDVAQAFGIVCIVTNAIPGWVERAMKNWLPRLWPYICGLGQRPPIEVLYGHKFDVRPSSLELPWVDELGIFTQWKEDAMTMALNRVDELYRLSGCNSIPQCRRDPLPDVSWCANSGQKLIANVISVGGGEAEMQAAELACRGYNERRTSGLTTHDDIGTDGGGGGGNRNASLDDSEGLRGPVTSCSSALRVDRNAHSGFAAALVDSSARGRRQQRSPGKPRARSISGVGRANVPGARSSHWPWVKLVKLAEFPNCRQLCTQLEELAELLPQMVALRMHVRADLRQCQDFPLTPLPRSRQELRSTFLCCSEAELQTERVLRTQTV